MKQSFRKILEDTPIIAAVKNDEGLEKCLQTDIGVVFILYGDLLTIEDTVRKIKDAGKVAMVHMDLVAGLSSKDVSIDFLKQRTRADGIISTKASLIQHAKKLGMYTAMRFFVMDSMALANVDQQANTIMPDVIEILPGVMPKIITRVNQFSRVPVIAGGLIADKDDVIMALKSGAVAVSATSPNVWEM